MKILTDYFILKWIGSGCCWTEHIFTFIKTWCRFNSCWAEHNICSYCFQPNLRLAQPIFGLIISLENIPNIHPKSTRRKIIHPKSNTNRYLCLALGTGWCVTNWYLRPFTGCFKRKISLFSLQVLCRWDGKGGAREAGGHGFESQLPHACVYFSMTTRALVTGSFTRCLRPRL